MGERTVIARAIGSQAARILCPGSAGRVLASFSRICDLVTDEGAVVALAGSGAERGPLTVVLEPGAPGDLWAGLVVGAAFQVRTGELRLFRSGAPLRVDLSCAAPWEAGLPWETLQPRCEQIRNSAGIVSGIVTQAETVRAGLCWDSRLSQATQAVLGAQRRRDRSALKAAIGNLCGLGEGLTPQGDDWLAGWLLGLRLAEPMGVNGWAPEQLGAMVLELAASRTTILSRAFLACAAAGEAAESWHLLLSQMAQDPAHGRALDRATRTVLAHGATSGAAMLKGFLVRLGDVPSSPATRHWEGALFPTPVQAALRPPILGRNT